MRRIRDLWRSRDNSRTRRGGISTVAPCAAVRQFSSFFCARWITTASVQFRQPLTCHRPSFNLDFRWLDYETSSTLLTWTSVLISSQQVGDFYYHCLYFHNIVRKWYVRRLLSLLDCLGFVPNFSFKTENESAVETPEPPQPPQPPQRMTRRQILTLISIASVNFSSMICYSILGPFFPTEVREQNLAEVW